MPIQSESIAKLADALSKAQGEMQNAAKDKDNPFFKSTYADLASVWDACRLPLSKNGLSIIQPVETAEGRVILTTTLFHMSGEYVSSHVVINPVKNDPQSVGSAITYYRRFMLASLVGIAPAEKPTPDDVANDDDDGNAAGSADKRLAARMDLKKLFEERGVPKELISAFFKHHQVDRWSNLDDVAVEDGFKYIESNFPKK